MANFGITDRLHQFRTSVQLAVAVAVIAVVLVTLVVAGRAWKHAQVEKCRSDVMAVYNSGSHLVDPAPYLAKCG